MNTLSTEELRVFWSNIDEYVSNRDLPSLVGHLAYYFTMRFSNVFSFKKNNDILM